MCQPSSLGVKYQNHLIQKRHTGLLQQRINAMFKIIFIFMLLFLALANLTLLNLHLTDQFIMKIPSV